MDKLVIVVAMTGAEATKANNPALPVSPEEIIRSAVQCRQAGASVVHLHVRDAEGKPTQDVEVFRRVVEGIRRETDLIVQISTGGAVTASPESRIAPLVLKPDMASLTTGTVNFGDDVFMNPPSMIETFATRMKELGIRPEVEVFEAGMVANAIRLAKQGLIEEPMHFDFVMGVPGGIPGTPADLMHLVASIPAGATWQVAGIGRAELPLGTMAILLGGHVRVGFEDNVYYAKGVLAENNAQLAARIARISRELGREVATPAEARGILRVKNQEG